MARSGINREQIFKLAKELALNDQLPTALKIRKKLATGSMATIQKYLQEWKKACFSKSSINLTPDTETQTYHVLMEENRSLVESFNKQSKQIEHYAQQLIDSEKANVSLKEEIHQLQNTTQKLQLNLTEMKVAKNCLEQTNKEIQSKLDINSNKAIEKMQQTIDDLRLELKTLNETYINALRETSNQGHEVIMQEKVNSINLQAKIDRLTKELLESKKQYHEAIMTAQVQNRSLTRQNEQLQRMIQEHGLDKLLQSEEGATVKFTNGAAYYGK